MIVFLLYIEASNLTYHRVKVVVELRHIYTQVSTEEFPMKKNKIQNGSSKNAAKYIIFNPSPSLPANRYLKCSMSKGFNTHEILSNIEKTKKCFSSPYHNLSVVVVDFVVIVVVVHFSHFHLLFQNHWINFNQTWHKTSLSEGDSSFFK